MTERFVQPHNELPKMKLDLQGSEFEATPENTTLFTFLGRIACYSHVFIQTGPEDDEVMVGTYVFASHPVYENMAQFMAEYGYPMHTNLREVADCDVNAYDRMISQQTNDLDHIPDEWLGNETRD